MPAVITYLANLYCWAIKIFMNHLSDVELLDCSLLFFSFRWSLWNINMRENPETLMIFKVQKLQV